MSRTGTLCFCPLPGQSRHGWHLPASSSRAMYSRHCSRTQRHGHWPFLEEAENDATAALLGAESCRETAVAKKCGSRLNEGAETKRKEHTLDAKNYANQPPSVKSCTALFQ
jgi:hypothetical protein